ncbi:hypothetical protein Cgig2_006375 [Carnegiea gigantea]|uniref:Uncharacterized protein n=1 Tax=Carnegiea gigantea TaxID=171969 RepID=A0A9Q1QDF4_9CARY|nr:hypothetical protein Cgig2_006375 [Carnegiea gigantea]
MDEKSACKVCGRYGHEEAVCFEVIEYPPEWGTHGGGRCNRGGRSGRGGRGVSRGRGGSREYVSALFQGTGQNSRGAGPNLGTGSEEGTGPIAMANAETAAQVTIPGLSPDQECGPSIGDFSPAQQQEMNKAKGSPLDSSPESSQPGESEVRGSSEAGPVQGPTSSGPADPPSQLEVQSDYDQPSAPNTATGSGPSDKKATRAQKPPARFIRLRKKIGNSFEQGTFSDILTVFGEDLVYSIQKRLGLDSGRLPWELGSLLPAYSAIASACLVSKLPDRPNAVAEWLEFKA